MPRLKARGRPPKAQGLSERQERFCREYMIDLNATQAYIRAGYSKGGAEASASTLLRNPKVQAFLEKLRAPLNKRYEITQERILAELARLSFSSLGHITKLDKDGNPHFDLTKAGEDEWASIQQMEVSELVIGDEKVKKEGDDEQDDEPQDVRRISKIVKIKLKHHDKGSALKALAIHAGINVGQNQKVQHVGKDDGPIVSKWEEPIDMNDIQAKRDLARRIAFLLKPGIQAAIEKGKIK